MSVIECELRRQINVGRSGKFMVFTGSPTTPNTSIEKLRKFIELARKNCKRALALNTLRGTQCYKLLSKARTSS